MTEEIIFGALIGLAGAATQNGKTADTDEIIRQGLTSAPSEEVLALIHGEKFRIAPGCATCAYPCGNTSDYDMSRNRSNSEEVQDLKQAIMAELKAMAARTTGELPDSAYQALSYLSYDLSADSYEELLQEMRL
jgi:hydroxylamine reductase